MADTKLLIHFNGADGATTYTAETGQTVTFGGNAQLDTAQSKFGTASLLCDGTTDYVTVPASSDWVLGTSDFTYECWVRFASVGTTQDFIVQGPDTTHWNRFWWDQTSNRLQFYSLNGASSELYAYCSWTPSINTWYHIVFVRSYSGNQGYFFINGVSQSITLSAGAYNANISDKGGVLRVGAYADNSESVNGWLDEVRVSNVARWTTNFTPPTEEYPGINSPSPSLSPSASPSASPSLSPSASPSLSPSASPSLSPSLSPSFSPSISPSFSPSLSPSVSPSLSPSISPSFSPSLSPSLSPSVSPSPSPGIPVEIHSFISEIKPISNL